MKGIEHIVGVGKITYIEVNLFHNTLKQLLTRDVGRVVNIFPDVTLPEIVFDHSAEPCEGDAMP